MAEALCKLFHFISSFGLVLCLLSGLACMQDELQGPPSAPLGRKHLNTALILKGLALETNLQFADIAKRCKLKMFYIDYLTKPGAESTFTQVCKRIREKEENINKFQIFLCNHLVTAQIYPGTLEGSRPPGWEPVSYSIKMLLTH